MAARVKIHFREEPRSVGEAESSVTFTARTLVVRGALLVSIEGDGSEAGTGYDERFEMIPEQGAELSADRRGLLAAVCGYPQMTRSRDGGRETVVVRVEPLFASDGDGWTARMSLYPPPEGETLPDVAALVAMLRQEGVTYGIREKNLAAALAMVKAEGVPHLNQVVARGRLPVNGEDARLRLDIACGAQAGEEQGDGQMDFRERNLFIEVDEGQLLATRIPATAGLAGVNVYGQPVAQQAGKDLVLKTGEDVHVDAVSGEVRAAIAGVLSATGDSGVKVTAKLTISGDIDFQTGNVRSRDAVEISGTVRPGFVVSAGGNVVVGGTVEAATVECGGNVLVRGGISGEDALVQADGDVDVPVLSHGVISAGGAVRIAREAYYAKVRCKGEIVFPGEARVLGCELLAGGSITVASVDTEFSPNSLLAAAVVPERYARYYRLLKSFHQAQAKVDAWRRRFGEGAQGEEIDELLEDLEDTRRAAASYNLIPGAGERDRAGGLRYACRQRISISGVIHMGAVIRIGNSEVTLKKGFAEGWFALNGESGRVEFHHQAKGPAAFGPEVL